MKWLLQGGCPWGFETETFDCAARSGNLENMKWLLQEGCPWGSEDFYEDFYVEDDFIDMEVVRLKIQES